MEPIRVKKLRENAIMPTYGSSEAAGADLYACLEEPMRIQPGESVFIPTGLSMELPCGYAGLIYARSGLACKRGLAPANKVGVVDSDYRGEITFKFKPLPKLFGEQMEDYNVGDRIGQITFMAYPRVQFEEVEQLSETSRGRGGYGSTGK